MKLFSVEMICFCMLLYTLTDARPIHDGEDVVELQLPSALARKVGDDQELAQQLLKGHIFPIPVLKDPYRQSPGMPYWPFTSNDFWAYVEYFRTLGAYHRINEMARTFFAHHPLGNILGYDAPYHDH